MNGQKPTDRGLARLDRWPRYVAGMVTEVAFVAVLTVVALLLALLAEAVF